MGKTVPAYRWTLEDEIARWKRSDCQKDAAAQMHHKHNEVRPRDKI